MATFKAYWQTLASRLGDWGTFTSTSVSGDASTIVASSLIDSTVSSDRYRFHYVYALDGALKGAQRVVTKLGFDNTTGTLTVSNAFASTPQTAVNWAILKHFGVIQHDRKPGLREFINQALSDLFIHDYVPVISTGSTDIRYTLPTSTNWWITDPNTILGLWQPYPNSTDRRQIDRKDWELIMDGESPIVQLRSGYTTGDIFELEVRRPANSRLNLTGSFADQSDPMAGLVDDDDVAIPSVSAVSSIALAYAYEAKVNEPGLGEAISYWENKLKSQQREAEIYRRSSLIQPKQPMYFRGGPMGAFR